MRLAAEVTETENLFETLANKSPVGLYIVQDGRFCYTNSTFQTATGYKEDELLGRDSLELVVPEDRERVRENAIKILKGEPASPYQFRVISKDGSIVWVMESVVSIQYRRRPATLGTFMDITERKQVEEMLQAEKNKLQSLVDALEYGLTIQDKDYNITYQNRVLRRIFGDRLGEKCYRVYEGRESICEDCPVEKAFRKGKPHTSERKTILPSGEVAFWENTANPIRDAQGRIVSCIEIARDITERKQAEEEMQHLNLVIRAIRNINHLIARGTDRYSLLKDACDTFVETRGYYSAWIALLDDSGKLVTAAEAGLGKSFLQIIERLKRGKLMHCGHKVLEKPGVLVIKDVSSECEDCPVVKRCGGRDAMSTRLEHNGKMYGLMTVSTPPGRAVEKEEPDLFEEIAGDIAFVLHDMEQEQERKRMEEALRDSEEKLRKMFESVTDGISVINLKGIITEVNKRTVEIHGFSSKDELLGKSAFELVAPRHHKKIAADMKKAIKKGAIRGVEYTLLRADGSEFFGELSTNALKDASGNLVGHITIARDITERKKAEEKLRQSEENYRALFHSSLIGTFVLDAETMKVVKANKAAAEMFGFSSAEEGIGVNPLDLVSPEDRKRVFTVIANDMFEQDLCQTNEFRMLTKDGREIWISAVGTRIMHDGRLAGLVYFTDITEQKQQNERLMMADRLASIGELASGAAHELNNPLTSIIGFSQLLMEKDISDDIREDVKLIYNEAQRAVNVTNNFLTFARKHTPLKEPNQINNIIEDVLELHAHEHKVNHIHVEKHLAPNLPEIMVDYFQMQQVFVNIIINAEYFMVEAHNGGTLTITTKKQNNNVRISIADDGPGIPPENLGRIFNPFFTTKEAGRGTGLGLSICHGIVTEHGGQIYVRSQLGKGTTIFIDLPIKNLTHF
ncbi:MAG: PAS domain S-box protein [Chloroflexota bacterium]